MPWNEDEEAGEEVGGLSYAIELMFNTFRSFFRALKEQGLPGIGKRPKEFKHSEALREKIQRLVEKSKPCVPDYGPKTVTESDMDSDSDDDSSAVSATGFPWPSTFTHRTPEVVDRPNRSLKEATQANIEIYGVMANLALEYYNFIERANLKLVEVTVASEDSDSVQRMHINFIASSDGHSESLLFAELINDCDITESDLSGFYVKGCCVIEKVDSGNPLGRTCHVCSEEVQHPGPAYGCRIISGDLFQGYKFWEYHPSAYELSGPRFRPIHLAKLAESVLYVVSAKKALEYFNSKQQQQLTKFKDAEVTAGAHCTRANNGTVVHINFMAQLLSGGSEQQLFFAVLSIPRFDIEQGWEDWKEPFVKVEACCRLEKVDSGNPFGRVCGLCRVYSFGTVIHPSPRDGHTAADGDDFTGYAFMNMSTGIY